MAGVNKVILLGHVGADPEIRHLEGGTAMARFRIATGETYKDKSGQRTEHTEWHNIIAWRNLVETVEKEVKKGTLVYVEGKLRNRTWNDKNGHKNSTTEIFAEIINIVHQKREETAQPNKSINITLPSSGNAESDNLPF